MIEACKCLNGLSPDIMNDVLAVSKHRCNSRHYNLLVTDRPKTDRYGRNSIPYRANQIRNLLPCEIKYSANLDSFKLKTSPCALCENIFTQSRIFIGSNFIS